MLAVTELLAVWPIPAYGALLLTDGSLVTSRAGAGSVHRVTRSTVQTEAFLGAAIPIGAASTCFAAVAAYPASITEAPRLSADATLAAVGRPAVQDAAIWSSPEVPSALALSQHAAPVPAAVWRLASRLVDTHDC